MYKLKNTLDIVPENMAYFLELGEIWLVLKIFS